MFNDDIVIRPVKSSEVAEIGKLYTRLTDYLALTKNYCGWKTGIYPTVEVAQSAFDSKSLFAAIKSDKIAGTFSLNEEQNEEYEKGNWSDNNRPLVLHTLAVDPDFMGDGIAVKLLQFADAFALKNGYTSIRLDTSKQNIPAISLYKKCGYRNAGTVDLGLNRGGIREWILFEKVIKKTTD